MANMYFDTFIAVAEDSPTSVSKKPKVREKPTVAQMQYDMLVDHPFEFTMEDVLFEVWFRRQGAEHVAPDEKLALREDFLSKPMACLRASPLSKSHGFGFAFDSDGRVALVPMESDAYRGYAARDDLAQTRAMASKRRKPT